MPGSDAWPPSRPDNDLGPDGVPKNADLPKRVAGHVQTEGSNNSGYSPFSVKNSRVITATKTGSDLVEGQAAVPSGQPADDVTSASDIELTLRRAQLSMGETSHRSNNPGHIGDAHHVGMNLRQRDNRMVFGNDWGTPKRLSRFRLKRPQDRWRERLADRRSARKQARLNLGSMLLHLSDRGVFTDRKGTTASHVSGLLRKAIGLSDDAKLVQPPGEEADLVEGRPGGVPVTTVGALGRHVDAAVADVKSDLAATEGLEDRREGGVSGVGEGGHQ